MMGCALWPPIPKSCAVASAVTKEALQKASRILMASKAPTPPLSSSRPEAVSPPPPPRKSASASAQSTPQSMDLIEAYCIPIKRPDHVSREEWEHAVERLQSVAIHRNEYMGLDTIVIPTTRDDFCIKYIQP